MAPTWPSVSTSFRRKRFALITDLFGAVQTGKSKIRVLDIGGTYAYWSEHEQLWSGFPLEITLVNLRAEDVPDPRFRSIAGNGCHLPEFEDREFDVVHSNSVIEHVGRWRQMRAMANEVARLAPAYYVQTPAFWCPIEPHFRAPMIHWLPEPMRIAAVLNFKLGFYNRASDLDEAMSCVEDAVLLDQRRMRALFPEAHLVKERLGGVMIKSYIAIRRPPQTVELCPAQ